MNPSSSLAHRAFALLCTVLVLALGLVGACDQLHARLHAAPDCRHSHAPDLPASSDDAHDVTCAVELFASGASLPVDPTHVLVAPLVAAAPAGLNTHEFSAAEGEHRLPPGCGPPQV